MEAATINMGDLTEVLFALGLTHYTIKGSVSEGDIFGSLNDIPSVPFENTYSRGNTDVSLILHGKESVNNMLGGNFKSMSPDHQAQIKDIVSNIVKHLPSLKTIKKVDAFISSVEQLDNKDFSIVIKSSGSKTTQLDEVKADVTMELISKTNIEVPKNIKKVVYSVKYSKDKSTSKVAENSIFTLILRLGNAFNLPMVSGLQGMRSMPYQITPQFGSKWLFEFFEENPTYKKLSLQENHIFNFIRKMLSQSDSSQREMVLKQFLLEFNEEMTIKEKQQPKFSTVLYDFLEKEIFGQDSADVVKIDTSGIKDIDVESYNKIRNNFLVDFSTRPTKSKNLIFKFEAVAKDGSSFLLFWIENHKSGTVQIHIGDDLLK